MTHKNIPRPSRFLTSSLRRSSSFSLKTLPQNYDDFLTKAEQEKFSALIPGLEPNEPLTPALTNTEPTSKEEFSEWFADDFMEPKATVNIPKPNSVNVKESKEADIDGNEAPKKSSKMEVGETSPAPQKRAPRKSSVKDELQTDAEPIKPKAAAKSKASSSKFGANSNQNYRTMKLKAKGFKQGGQKTTSKFAKTKKLSSYNNYKSTDADADNLLSGYIDESEAPLVDLKQSVEVANEVESIAEPQPENETEFGVDIFLSSHDTQDTLPDYHCSVSGNYSASDAVQVDLLKSLEKLTGYKEFRKGQLEVIKRVLAAKSTLLVLPTAGGKSLCYQLPAFIIRNVTKSFHSMVLVISPTISLINDQLRCLPSGLRGACIANSLTAVS